MSDCRAVKAEARRSLFLASEVARVGQEDAGDELTKKNENDKIRHSTSRRWLAPSIRLRNQLKGKRSKER